MPTLRQPWVRLWVEALEHPKIALLSDSQYRTWTACLLRASQQPRRWTFKNVEQAATVTGRPRVQVQALVGSLLDVQPGRHRDHPRLADLATPRRPRRVRERTRSRTRSVRETSGIRT